jgi:hypothetical protein
MIRLCQNSKYRQFLVRVISCGFVDRLLSSGKSDPRASHEITRTKSRGKFRGFDTVSAVSGSFKSFLAAAISEQFHKSSTAYKALLPRKDLNHPLTAVSGVFAFCKTLEPS